MRKLQYNNQEFIKRCNEVHNNFYDYSKVKYEGNCKRIDVICPIHGLFRVLRRTHLRGIKCKKCTPQKMAFTKQQFVRRSNIIHNNKFDYSRTIYKNTKEKIKIVCPKHGQIQIWPRVHLKGGDCRKCSLDTRQRNGWTNPYDPLTKQQIISSAVKIHGNKYDYSLVQNERYKQDHIQIICKQHGKFKQKVAMHLRGRNCYHCSRKIAQQKTRMTTQQFIRKAKSVHGDRFDYSLTDLGDKGRNTKVKIICNINNHGIFQQNCGKHLNTQGCPKCRKQQTIKRNKSVIRSQQQFLSQIKAIHNNRYDYSRVVYKGNEQKIQIGCSIHGFFWQVRHYHLYAHSGCPFCKRSKGQLKVKDYLDSKNIKYQRHKYFDDCRRDCQSIRYLYYDFYLPQQHTCIQYDGRQHFIPTNFANFGMPADPKQFQKVQLRDSIKNKYCADKGIKLIRIPYTQFDNLQSILESSLIQEPAHVR